MGDAVTGVSLSGKTLVEGKLVNRLWRI